MGLAQRPGRTSLLGSRFGKYRERLKIITDARSWVLPHAHFLSSWPGLVNGLTVDNQENNGDVVEKQPMLMTIQTVV